MKIAHWACFEADPESEPPFAIRIGFSEGRQLGEIRIEKCSSVPAGAKKVMARLKKDEMSRTQRFYFIYPQYDVENEMAMNNIAGLILDETIKLGIGFERNILPLKESDVEDPIPCV